MSKEESSPLPVCHDTVRFMRSDELVGAYTHHEVHRRERELRLTKLESVAEMKEIIYTLKNQNKKYISFKMGTEEWLPSGKHSPSA